MLAWLTQVRERHRNARSLYGSIVTQARSHRIYEDWRVPDTVEGRFDMIALHLAMLLRRLRREGAAGHRLGRALTEVFASDVDDNLREMTVGDLAVPREVKKAVGALQERCAAYETAFASRTGEALGATIRARIGASSPAQDLDVGAICAYIGDANRQLEALSGPDILAGQVVWPRIGDL
jgi:cytochrome b pre-mRNA-processing protein 3